MAKRKSAPRLKRRTGRFPPQSPARILEEYLAELKAIRSTGAGVPETSYYPALSNLFNAVGKTLKPKVRCIINISNQGAGMPDGGLFTADQFQRQADGEPKAGQLPARGAIEAKGTKPDAKAIAAKRTGQGVPENATASCIVTNLRDFLIVERGPDGRAGRSANPSPWPTMRTDFWQHKAAHPRAAAQAAGRAIHRVHQAVLPSRRAADQSERRGVVPGVLRPRCPVPRRAAEGIAGPANRPIRLGRSLGDEVHRREGRAFLPLYAGANPLLRRVLGVGPLAQGQPRPEGEVRLADGRMVPARSVHPHLVSSRWPSRASWDRWDWWKCWIGPAGVLNRVDRGEFFKRFEDEHAVQYFYEPFLEAYDPELRKALGVWYTPPEIVKYQVARVDRVLREELDLPDGLADPNVIVLDPCCGTGAYLVEVLHSIAATLRDKGGDALVASDLKQAAMNRVFGFEIMPAPFVVSHLQLGLMLQNQGAPLSQKEGRARRRVPDQRPDRLGAAQGPQATGHAMGRA